MSRSSPIFSRLRDEFSAFPPPVIVFNKSHSGSRLLAQLLQSQGFYLGSRLNESEDAFDVLNLIRPLVETWYPDYSELFRNGDDAIEELARTVLLGHVADLPANTPWGWKLCETLYILPVLARIFPDATYVHLVRDGRDVAFCDHVAPVQPFWRKVYFDTDQIKHWNGWRLSRSAYRGSSHVFNARHWVNSVTVARHYGAMIGERYLEVRYEDLVNAPARFAEDLFAGLDRPLLAPQLASFVASVDPARKNKFDSQSWWKRRAALRVLEPTLTSFGYGDGETSALPRMTLKRS